MRKRTVGQKIFAFFNAIFMIAVGVLCLYPMLHVIFASFSESHLLASHQGPLLCFEGFSVEAYNAIFSNNVILNGYVNTLFVLVVGTGINILLTLIAAYVLSAQKLFWKVPLMMLIIITMYFQGGLIPTYLTVKNIGIYDTRWALILPVAVNSFNLIIMRTSFAEIPQSLMESAELDGANDFDKLARIVIPLSMPVIAVILLYYGVYHWNSWFSATIYMQTKKKLPLQVVLREILILNETGAMSQSDSGYNIGETIKYATIVVSTVPILAVYPFLQKYFAKGIMVGAIKG